jgi:hypothetical protein
VKFPREKIRASHVSIDQIVKTFAKSFAYLRLSTLFCFQSKVLP